ncbi:hypothetical protein ABI59_17055 [Acidobacteria bacterium Mor1]|nr:hypothetical protein ABI59_17055 [Acidobacteria bacterium Mor1]
MDIGLALFLSVGALAFFSFLSILIFAESRSRERREFQRNETLRKVADQSGAGGNQVLEVIREEEKIGQRKRTEAIKLTGLVMLMLGSGLGIFLYTAVPEVTAVAAMPVLLGLGLLGYVVALAPKAQ